MNFWICMGKESQKSALPTLFHFVWVRATYQPHVYDQSGCLGLFACSKVQSRILTAWKVHYKPQTWGKILNNGILTFLPSERVQLNKQMCPVWNWDVFMLLFSLFFLNSVEWCFSLLPITFLYYLFKSFPSLIVKLQIKMFQQM